MACRKIAVNAVDFALMTFRRTMTFRSTDDYFARQVVSSVVRRATSLRCTAGFVAVVQPVGAGLSLRIESPDRSPQELHTIEDWLSSGL